MRDKKRKSSSESNEPAGAPLWMVTYGDMMTLLLVFFVLIVSFSTIEIEKFKAALGAFRGALMPWAPASTGASMMQKLPLNQTDEMFETAPDNVSELAEDIQAMIEREKMSDMVEVYQVGGGVKIVFSNPVLFDEGDHLLKPNVSSVLEGVAKVAQKAKASEILIEGHTDDTPISNERFPSNWELSAARALQVLKFFQSLGVPPEKLVAVGYGEYRPRVKLPPDATREEKGVNRRVEIFLNLRNQPTIGNQVDFGYETYFEGRERANWDE